MAETATSTTYTYCGEPEPTDACERGGWCDYHLGASDPPDDFGGPGSDTRADEGHDDPEGRAPYDDGGRQPCGCSPEFHSARCTR